MTFDFKKYRKAQLPRVTIVDKSFYLVTTEEGELDFFVHGNVIRVDEEGRLLVLKFIKEVFG